MELESISCDDQHASGAVGNVLIAVYDAKPTAAMIRPRVAWGHRAMSQYESIGLLLVASEKASALGLPNREFQRESARHIAMFRSHVRCVASIVEGEGLIRSLYRAFLRAQAAVARGQINFGHFGTLREASQWVSENIAEEGSPTGSEIMHATLKLSRRSLRPQAPT